MALTVTGVMLVTGVPRAPLQGDVAVPEDVLRPVVVTTDGATTVTVVLDSIERRSIVYRGSGTVTEMVLTVGGGSPANGGLAMSVSDLPVVAHYDTAPIAADVGVSSPPAAIRRVQRFLAAVGHDVEPDGVMGASTITAVRAFRDSVQRPAGDSFPVDAVVWLGPQRTQVAEVLVQVGDDIQPGAPIGSLGVVSAQVTVEAAGGLPLDGSSDWVLEVGGESFQLQAARLELSPAQQRELAPLLDLDAPTAATVRRHTPIRRVVLPGPSVISDGELTCVVDAVTRQPVPVTVVADDIGGIGVSFSGDPPTEILADPATGVNCNGA